MRIGRAVDTLGEEGTLAAGNVPPFITRVAVLLLPSTCGMRRHDSFRAAVELS